jgi:hypothetical protein
MNKTALYKVLGIHGISVVWNRLGRFRKKTRKAHMQGILAIKSEGSKPAQKISEPVRNKSQPALREKETG